MFIETDEIILVFLLLIRGFSMKIFFFLLFFFKIFYWLILELNIFLRFIEMFSLLAFLNPKVELRPNIAKSYFSYSLIIL